MSDFSLGVALPPEDGFPARSPRRRRTAHCAPQAVQRVTPNRVIPARCFGAYLSGVAASPDRVARSPLLADRPPPLARCACIPAPAAPDCE